MEQPRQPPQPRWKRILRDRLLCGTSALSYKDDVETVDLKDLPRDVMNVGGSKRAQKKHFARVIEIARREKIAEVGVPDRFKHSSRTARD